MTIVAQNTRIQYVGSASPAEEYPVTFKFMDTADLAVVHTNALEVDTRLIMNTDYTVTGAGDDMGGTVTVVNPDYLPTVGQRLTIYLDMKINQEILDVTNGQAFLPEVVENSDDRIVLLIQQLANNLSRCMQYDASTSDDAIDADMSVLLETKTVAVSAAASAQASAASASAFAENSAEEAATAAAAAASLPSLAGNANRYLQVNEDASGYNLLTASEALAALGGEPADGNLVKAPAGVLPPLDGSRLTGLARGLNVAPQTVLAAPTGSKISGWADGDQDAPVLSLHTASDIGDTYYSAERVDASLVAGEVGVAPGIVVAYAWGGTVYASGASPDGLFLDLSGAADGVYHIYADLNEEGSWAGVGYSALYPAYGTARRTPGSDLYNTATVRMYDGADNAVRRVYVGRVEMAGGVPTEVVEAPIGTSVTLPVASGAIIGKSATYVEPNPFSGPASIEWELYARTRASETDIRWQRVDGSQFLSNNGRIFGSSPTCINADVAIVSTGNWALAPYTIYFDGVTNCPGRIKLTRGF